MVKGQMKHDGRDGGHGRKNQEKQDGYKPCGAALILRRWLGYAKGVDEGIRQKEKRTHGDWIIVHVSAKRHFVHPARGERIL